MTDEFKRIQMIERLLDRRSPHVEIGIGDDAAVLRASDEKLVCSVDVSVEGVHFQRAWLGLREIGRRAFIAAASDLAAMGASPHASLLSLVVPQALSDADLRQIVLGVSEAANQIKCPVVGGNLSRGSEITVTTTVLGQCPGAPLTRSGARAGDVLCVSGTLGDAALGLRWLQAGGDLNDSRARPFIRSWRRPEAEIKLGIALRDVATAAIDISDGLMGDLRHMSGRVGFEVRAEQIPLSGGFRELCGAMDVDAMGLALNGGEDYRLLFTCPEGARPPGTTVIGRVTSSPGARVLDASGGRVSIPMVGHDHFRDTNG